MDFGLRIGEVVRPVSNDANAKDTYPNRIQVKVLHGVNSTSKQPEYKVVNARVLASFAGFDTQTSTSYGSVIIPQTGEQVLIGYLNGDDTSDAYVLGSVYQGLIKPPCDISKDKVDSDVEKAGESIVIKLKNKTQISVNNVSATDTSVVIKTGGNNRVIKLMDKQGEESFLQISDGAEPPQTYLKMDFQNGAIECKAAKKVTFAAGENDNGSIIIDGGSGNIDINSTQGKVTINSQQGSTLSCGAASKVELNQQGTGIKGTQVEVQGTASVKIGSMVQLG